MKNKKRFVSLVICALILSFNLNMNVFATQSSNNWHVTQNTESSAMPTAAEIVWKYKIENGVVYKRQYNTLTQQWIGDWIKA